MPEIPVPPTAPSFSIETALEDAILAQQNGREPKARTAFYASSLGHCLRKQVAERAGLVPTNPPNRRARIKMWIGQVYGVAIQRALQESGFLNPAWHEKRVEYKSYVGKLDGYAPHIQGGAVVEIKTADDSSITRYHEMPEHYKFQGFFYCVATGVPNLLLLQVGKGQGLVKHRVYPCDKFAHTLINSHIGEAEKAWEEYQATGKLPPHTHRFSWEDKYCGYLELEESETLYGKEDG